MVLSKFNFSSVVCSAISFIPPSNAIVDSTEATDALPIKYLDALNVKESGFIAASPENIATSLGSDRVLATLFCAANRVIEDRNLAGYNVYKFAIS